MRGLTLLVLAFVVGCGVDTRAPHKFVPDNDLWMEDSLNLSNCGTDVQEGCDTPEMVFNKIIDIGQSLYNETARQWGETLTFTRLWTDPTVNASAWRDGYGSTEIVMYGGMARRPEVLPLSFALVMCHELNHLYGGAPYIDSSLRMAAEGQSDWMGAQWCLYNVTLQLKDTTPFQQTPFMRNACKDEFTCLQKLGASEGLGRLLATLGGGKIPNFETPDPTVVSKTNVSYPRTAQCRLDSYFRGVMGQARPLCWFKP